MKKFWMPVILIAAILMLAVGASATCAARLRVNVPFAFYVDKDLLPPGEYYFEMRALSPYAASSSAVLISNLDGGIVTWIATMPGAGPRSATTDHLQFNKYGSTYFLSRVECSDYQANLKRARAEKELQARATTARETILVATK